MAFGCSRVTKPYPKDLKQLYDILGFKDMDQDGIIEKKSMKNLWANEGYDSGMDMNNDGKVVPAEAKYYLYYYSGITDKQILAKFKPTKQDRETLEKTVTNILPLALGPMKIDNCPDNIYRKQFNVLQSIYMLLDRKSYKEALAEARAVEGSEIKADTMFYIAYKMKHDKYPIDQIFGVIKEAILAMPIYTYDFSGTSYFNIILGMRLSRPEVYKLLDVCYKAADQVDFGDEKYIRENFQMDICVSAINGGYLEEGLQFANEKLHDPFLGLVYWSAAEQFLELGQKEKAMLYYKEGAIFSRWHSMVMKEEALQGVADQLIKFKMYDEAVSVSDHITKAFSDEWLRLYWEKDILQHWGNETDSISKEIAKSFRSEYLMYICRKLVGLKNYNKALDIARTKLTDSNSRAMVVFRVALALVSEGKNTSYVHQLLDQALDAFENNKYENFMVDDEFSEAADILAEKGFIAESKRVLQRITSKEDK